MIGIRDIENEKREMRSENSYSHISRPFLRVKIRNRLLQLEKVSHLSDKFIFSKIILLSVSSTV